MSWLPAIGLALAVMALGAWAFMPARRGWATLATTVALGLAGYALQANPGLPGAPAAGVRQASEVDWNSIDARKEMVRERDRSASNGLVMADAYSRQRRYAEAADLLRRALAQSPRDAEAWLALGNALVEHADGALTEPALVSYRRAEELSPGSTGPGYFLGLAMVRQGRLGEARGIWASTLRDAGPEAPGRVALEERLARLDALLQNPALLAPQAAP